MFGYSWDQLLSYETPKIAVINDRRLGLLYYTLLFLVFAYVAADVVLIEKRYLRLQAPVGSVRFSLLSPQTATPPVVPPPAYTLPYCQQSGSQYYGGGPTYQCIYWDEDYVLYPSVEATSMFITTRVSNTSQTQENGCSMDVNTCRFVDTEPASPPNYIANIENFTIMFDHSFYTSLGIEGNSNELPGQLLNHLGKPMSVSAPNRVGNAAANGLSGDILSVGEILTAAGISSLDDPSQASKNRTIRDDGIVIMMFIDYSNTFSYNTNKIRYQYRFEPIYSAKFKGLETIVTKNISSRVVYNRHGLRLIILQTGQLGVFDFQTLLLSVVTGMALITIAGLMIDYAIKYFRPLKNQYAPEKFIETEDWAVRLNRYDTLEPEHSSLTAGSQDPHYGLSNHHPEPQLEPDSA